MVYIVENNGVYGLTKGQFSATADRGSKAKRGAINNDNSIDLVAMAMQLGATFVARSFSGDKEQLVPIIKAAIEHKGAAFIDVISPCVAFNNHLGSTKSFDYVRKHNEAVNRLDFITGREPIKVDYEPGTVEIVEQHDGSKLALRKLNAEYDIHDKLAAMSFLLHHAAEGPDRHRAALRRQRSGRPARASRDRRRAAQCARREGAVPRLGGAGEVQRQFALIVAASQPRLRGGTSTRLLDGLHHLPLLGGRLPSFRGLDSGLPVSSTLLRLDRIAGQPERPPARIASGTSHECDSVMVSLTASPDCSMS